MEIRLKPETELRLNELASKSGHRTDDLVEDAMAAYLIEVAELRNTLDGRYEILRAIASNLLTVRLSLKTCAGAKVNSSSAAPRNDG